MSDHTDYIEKDDREVVHIYRWDMDKTYIKTDFETLRGLIKTAFQKPEDKTNVPGAVSLLRELCQSQEDERVIVTFVSGSPTQMREVLLKKFELDGIMPDLLVLKPIVQNILKGRFRAVKGQVGYKLGALLEARRASAIAPETLFGDDAEQDAFIYSLYADIAAGRIEPDALRAILVEAEVYASPMQKILNLYEEVERGETVGRVFINLEGRTPPGRFSPFGGRVVPIVNYFQAAIVLWVDGVLSIDGVFRIAAGMIARDDYGLMEFVNSFQDLLRRRVIGSDAVSRLEEESVDAATGHLPHDFANRFVGRVRALAPRNPVEARVVGSTTPDYLDILRSDRKLKEAVTEQRKPLFG